MDVDLDFDLYVKCACVWCVHVYVCARVHASPGADPGILGGPRFLKL